VGIRLRGRRASAFAHHLHKVDRWLSVGNHPSVWLFGVMLHRSKLEKWPAVLSQATYLIRPRYVEFTDEGKLLALCQISFKSLWPWLFDDNFGSEPNPLQILGGALYLSVFFDRSGISYRSSYDLSVFLAASGLYRPNRPNFLSGFSPARYHFLAT